MKKLKKITLTIIFLLLWVWVIFAADNFFRSWDNWDANVTWDPANDVWTFSWRLDLEDSRSSEYINNWYRGKLTWWVESDLFGTYITDSEFTLSLKWKYSDSTYTSEIKTKCLNWNNWTSWPEPEIYNINWSIKSNWSLNHSTWENLWGTLSTSWIDSYFCSNKKMFLHLSSDTLWNKAVWEWVVSDNDVFWKQEIYIQGIANINWNTASWILSRWDQEINKLKVYVWNNAMIKWNINKNIANIYKTYLNSSWWNKASWDIINNFNNSRNQENYYVYDYHNQTENISFKGSTYVNKWKKLIIENTSSDKIVEVKWINTVIVQWWNIYIKSDIKNSDDKQDLLILIAKRDKDTKNWWNIYIEPWVTNIDAVLIADWSLISMWWWNIQWIKDTNQVNSIRKQLLIYWKVLSSNNVWTDTMPYWADLYENSSYSNNKMDWNIYDLWNLRTFNLNYGWWDWVTSWCNNQNKLTPIKTTIKSWAWRRNCYLSDSTNNSLRWSDKLNPLIIENNNYINFLNPFVLRK